MKPHPASPARASLIVFLWRYFTGHHLDGKHRTNATWTRRATAPSHHMNWWTSKPRLHRMAWRWALVFIPTGWILAYSFSPVYGINLTLLITIAMVPYIFHKGITWAVSLIPRHTVVYVTDDIKRGYVGDDLDDEIIPEQLAPEDDIIQGALDMAVSDANESLFHASKRKARRP